ncbi:MAG: rhomboid family intramembrane serine protease [Pseudomonadota bacterium]
MFIPLSDKNPLQSIPFQFVTIALIAANVLVFAFSAIAQEPALVAGFAVVPNELFLVDIFGGTAPGTSQTYPIPEGTTLVSYMFFHADVFHLAGNMIFLWVFGDNVEDAMGHFKFLVFYIACGIAAAVLHAVMLPTSSLPLIGASGAVAGVIAAYLMLHPRVRVWVLAFKVIPLEISAALALGIWVATQVVMVMIPQVGPVAWWAHIGGLIAGAILIVVMKNPNIPLFDRGLTLPNRS